MCEEGVVDEKTPYPFNPPQAKRMHFCKWVCVSLSPEVSEYAPEQGLGNEYEEGDNHVVVVREGEVHEVPVLPVPTAFGKVEVRLRCKALKVGPIKEVSLYHTKNLCWHKEKTAYEAQKLMPKGPLVETFVYYLRQRPPPSLHEAC